MRGLPQSHAAWVVGRPFMQCVSKCRQETVQASVQVRPLAPPQTISICKAAVSSGAIDTQSS